MQLSDYVYLVTGGAGFIGSHIVEHLSRLHCKVVVVDNLSTGAFKNIEGIQNVDFIQADINDEKVIQEIFASRRIDVVFHLAALGSVNRSIENPLDTHLSNSTGFLNILNIARLYRVKGVIYASSSSVYGDNQDLPKREDRIGVPLSPYAVTKLTNELYAKVFWNLYQLPSIGLRYFNVFGPRQNPNGPYAAAIPIFIQKMLKDEEVHIHGTGEQKRDFTYVSNVVQANILALQAILDEKHVAFGEVFNIGCEQSISINQVFQVLSQKLNYRKSPVYIESRKGDIFQSLADITKARQLLNYQPEIYFEEGVDKTLEYYKKVILSQDR